MPFRMFPCRWMAVLAMTGACLGAQGEPPGLWETKGCRIPIQGVEHWVRRAGLRSAAPPLVILHGGPGGNHWTFERTLGPALERLAPVVYYEQRGCGRSAAPARDDAYSMPLLVEDLERLRARLGVERMVLLGYSFGGELALEYALAHPDRVAGLVLQNPSADSGISERLKRAQLEGFPQVAEGALRSRIQAILAGGGSVDEKLHRIWEEADVATVDRLMFRHPEAARLNRRFWEESGLSNSGKMALALEKAPRNPEPLASRARALRMPVLFLTGFHDRNVGVEIQRDLAAGIPRARMVLFMDSAHFPDLDEPAACQEAIRDFLEDLAGRHRGEPAPRWRVAGSR